MGNEEKSEKKTRGPEKARWFVAKEIQAANATALTESQALDLCASTEGQAAVWMCRKVHIVRKARAVAD